MSEVRPRWFTEHGPEHTQWYIERMRRKAVDGDDLAGEARVVDALVAPASRVLDAGCGPGRLCRALHERGHDVVGVDVDAGLIDAARADHPGPEYVVADLATMKLGGDPFDAVLVAGNVLVYVTPGSERDVLRRIAAHVRPDGVVVAGFATDREYRLDQFDRDCVAAGLQLEHRFATWDLRPWRTGAPWAVTVLRRPV